MRWIARVLVFTVALVCGTFTASLFHSDETIDLADLPVLTEADVAQEATGIRIMYAGWERGEDGPYLRFFVYNGLRHSISYAGYGPEFSPVDISVNGNVERVWECQNGTEHFTILPGRSAELRVDPLEFCSRPRKNDVIAVEFSFWASPQGETEYHTSEPFHLPEEFRRSIGPRR